MEIKRLLRRGPSVQYQGRRPVDGWVASTQSERSGAALNLLEATQLITRFTARARAAAGYSCIYCRKFPTVYPTF